MAFYTVVRCDNCGKSKGVEGILTKKLFTKIMRSREKWTIGKRHL